MKLPFGMNDGVKTIQEAMPEKKFLFNTIYVAALKTEDGHPVIGSIAPRFIFLFSEDQYALNQAMANIKNLFGDAMAYETDESGFIPESYDMDDKLAMPLLNRRSRALEAEVVNAVFEKGAVFEMWNLVMKSTFEIKVIEHKEQNGQLSYSATTGIKPSTADIIATSGILTYPNPIDAFEAVIASPHCNYEEVIDRDFDTCHISFTKFQGEFSPLQNNAEMNKYFRMQLVAAISNATKENKTIIT